MWLIAIHSMNEILCDRDYKNQQVSRTWRADTVAGFLFFITELSCLEDLSPSDPRAVRGSMAGLTSQCFKYTRQLPDFGSSASLKHKH